MTQSDHRWTRRQLLKVSAAAAMTGVAGCGGGGQGSTPTEASTASPTPSATASPSPTPTATPAATIEDAKQAISKYTDVGTALKDGYQSTLEYATNPNGEGAMGVHFLNPQIKGVDPTRPNVLMYDLTEKGQYELLGAEWFIPANAVDEAPQLFGQTFAGPMESHGPNQPRHYELHAWLFKDNPKGTFAAFNPAVSPPGYLETLRSAREAIRPYTKVSKAKEAGYQSTGECVEEDGGGMGIHFVNHDIKGVNPEKPPILMYQKASDGSMQLMGAEWLVPTSAVDSTPTLFGQKFNGPMEGHSPNQPRHYDLHAWLFRPNPAGMFTPLNPLVSC